jgi:hypothetical protein
MEKKARVIKELLGSLGILLLLFEIYRLLRRCWLQHLLEEKGKAKQSRKPAVLRPKMEGMELMR